jgi:hypothetical protein
MLDSVKISRRQSEIRQALAGLAAKPAPTEEEVRSMEVLGDEYATNETRYRAALVAEDAERREAGAELETRSGREWDELVQGFELRQIALALDEGRNLDGRTAEVVQELRAAGGFRGYPAPWAALEVRNTVSTGTPDPMNTRPIVDRLFPASVAGAMGGQMISIESGATEWPVVTSAVTAGWATSEGGNVAGPTAYTTVDKAMRPDFTLGITMRVSRRALKQSGAALEDAIRRDMQGAMQQAMDLAVFRGTGADGQPLGLLTTPATYGIAATAVGAAITSAVFRARLVAFMNANAIASPSAVRALIRPEAWDKLHSALVSGTAVSEWDRLTGAIPEANFVVSGHAMAAPAGSPAATSALLTTSTGGVAPFYVGLWGAIDLVRDPYSDAASGGLRLTALGSMDLTVARGVQLQIMTGLQ